METPTKPKYISCAETEIVIEIESTNPKVTSYEIQYKPNAQPWGVKDDTKTVSTNNQNVISVTLINLTPSTPYSIRIVAQSDEGDTSEPSPELIVDTDSVDCTDSKKCGCVIQ